MSYLYSPSTGGFYRKDLGSAPQDGVPVTAKRHAELMAAQRIGGAIVASATTGRPVIQYPRADAATRRASLTKSIKREAARRIAAVSPEWRQLNDMREQSEASAVRFAQIDAVRMASDAIETLLADVATAALETFRVRDNPLWPEIEEVA